jgi:hypothetical protein
LVLGCGKQKDRNNYVHFKIVVDEEKSEATRQYDGLVFRGFGILTSFELKGEQFGIVDGVGNEALQIFEVKGQSREKWIIEHDDILMGTWQIFKEESVVDIPEELKVFQDNFR